MPSIFLILVMTSQSHTVTPIASWGECQGMRDTLFASMPYSNGDEKKYMCYNSKTKIIEFARKS